METLRDKAEAIHTSLGLSQELSIEYLVIALEDAVTFDQKQADYGAGNIAKFSTAGVLVRVSDKIERLINLSNKSLTPNNESINDSWKDTSIYGVIARICLHGDWPGAD